MNLTIKNVPQPLYDRLRAAAKANRRSLNSEVIRSLEHAVGTGVVDTDALLRRLQAVRERAEAPYLTDDALRAMKEDGRA